MPKITPGRNEDREPEDADANQDTNREREHCGPMVS
jgi:hypothetical protein